MMAMAEKVIAKKVKEECGIMDEAQFHFIFERWITSLIPFSYLSVIKEG